MPHVHIHLLPRSPGDFEKNDEVYDELDSASMAREGGAAVKKMIDADVERKARSKEEMEKESRKLRALFVDFSQPIPDDEN